MNAPRIIEALIMIELKPDLLRTSWPVNKQEVSAGGMTAAVITDLAQI